MTRAEIEAMARAPHAYASADLSEALLTGLAQTTRTTLAGRRRNATTNAQWVAPDGTAHEFAVCVGMDDSGRVLEVFANHAKGAMAATLADACVLISIGLQHGITAQALSNSIPRIPSWPDGETRPASPIGTILDVILAADEPPMPVGVSAPVVGPDAGTAEPQPKITESTP